MHKKLRPHSRDGAASATTPACSGPNDLPIIFMTKLALRARGQRLCSAKDGDASSAADTQITAIFSPVRAVEIPPFLHKTTGSGNHAFIQAIHVTRRAQGLTLIPVGIASGQNGAENLIAAVGADDQVRAAVDAVDVGSGGSVKVGRCH